VARHADLVYSAALRQVGSADLASDVAQSVFTDLASKARPLAGKLAEGSSLVGWLYRSTRFAALTQLRGDRRRLANERQAMEQLLTNSESEADWERVRPLLDEAMAGLSDDDREAVLLRYFKNDDFRAIGQALGVSDDAAQKRVSRAVERLRDFLSRRGVTVGASVLVALISANAVQAAPASLAVTISAAALGGTTLITSATVIATKAIVMTTLQKTLLAAAVTVLAGAGIYEAHRASDLGGQLQLLQQQQGPLTDQIQQLQRDRDTFALHLAALRDERAASKPGQDELLKLRRENARLRNDLATVEKTKAASSDPLTSAAVSWKNRVALLKARMEATPGAKIPELQFVSDQDWLNAARGELKTDRDFREAMARLRSAGEGKFAGNLHSALSKYMETNNAQFPSDLSQLLPYFDSPVDSSLLERWTVVPAKSIQNLRMGGDWIITQRSAPDPEYDSRYGAGPNGYGSSGNFQEHPSAADVMTPALQAFYAANGRVPSEPAELAPYLTTEEQRTFLDKFTRKFNTLSDADKAQTKKELEQVVQGNSANPK